MCRTTQKRSHYIVIKWCLPFLLFIVGCHRPVHEHPYLAVTAHSPKRDVTLVPERSYRPGKEVVFLDPGHGGRDPGTQMRRWPYTQEKILTLELTKRVEQRLVKSGYPVVLSRYCDVYVSRSDRVHGAAQTQAAIFVSIHLNSAPNPLAKGAEIYYYNSPANATRSKASKRLGACVFRRMKQLLPVTPRDVKHGNLCVIRDTLCPAILVEVAFLSNPNEAKLLTTSTFKRKVTESIAQGIDDYFRGK